MKWMGINELRESFLSFFESKGHLRLQSASLVPRNDPSLLLISSGMSPLKNYFTGLEKPPAVRAASCQKCVRVIDIEQIGITSRHCTYFEMLGHFSFGDYFKREALMWTWEFYTETMGIEPSRLYPSVFFEDDEAYDIWVNEIGVEPSRVVRLGREDNFWDLGSGPCGPSSEIYFDRGIEKGCGKPDCKPGCECDRFIEIGNNVFTQFSNDGSGNYTPLVQKNIDFGGGLERLALVMQNVDSVHDIDTIQRITGHAAKLAGVKYGVSEHTDVSLRIISDHIRSTTFLVGDGVSPQNEGRGYVLRRLIRRAARHGRLIGITGPFLYKVCDTVMNENKTAYPELFENADYIRRIILAEEERFARTIEQGMHMLDGLLAKGAVSGGDMFRLYDTYGFPPDLTREIAREKNISVDEETFARLMREQRNRARKAREELGSAGWETDPLADLDIADQFIGYDKLETAAKVLAIIQNGELADRISCVGEAVIVLDETPFYAESGGQIGDSGKIICGDNIFEVNNCKKSPTGHTLHIGTMRFGAIEKGDKVSAQVSGRSLTARNHTATHLLHAALREILGGHVKQAGSLVDENALRFDFSHFEACTPEQLAQAESWVNDRIFGALSVTAAEMPMDEARAKGATALFGDKYGDVVRVVDIAGAGSCELCGGTHVDNTAKLGLFKILSESSVAAGVRRIEAVTGSGVLSLIAAQEKRIADVCAVLRANPAELRAEAMTVMSSNKEQKRKLEELEAQLAEQQMGTLGEQIIGSVRFVCAQMSGSMDPLRDKADKLKDRHPDIAGVFAAVNDGKVQLLAFAGKQAVQSGIHCGRLVKEVAAFGGGSGGGRPDNAMGAFADASKLADALAAAPGLVKSQLGL